MQRIPEIRRAKVKVMLGWLYEKRRRELEEIRFQAALHGVQLKGEGGRTASLEAQLAGVTEKPYSVKRVKVSPEELERRRKALGH